MTAYRSVHEYLPSRLELKRLPSEHKDTGHRQPRHKCRSPTNGERRVRSACRNRDDLFQMQPKAGLKVPGLKDRHCGILAWSSCPLMPAPVIYFRPVSVEEAELASVPEQKLAKEDPHRKSRMLRSL